MIQKKPTLHTSEIGHLQAVQDYPRLRPFTPEVAGQLQDFLYRQVAQTGDTAALLEFAHAWLTCQGVFPPNGKTTIERIVYRVRHQAEKDLFGRIADQLTLSQREQLDALCQASQGKSPLAALAAQPQAASAKSICEECSRLARIQAALPASIDWRPVHPSRLTQWAAIVRRLPAQALRRYPPAKRYTLLLAFLTERSQAITDAIVDMFDTLLGRVFAQAAAAQQEATVERSKMHLRSARIFRRITQVLLDARVPSESLREEIFQRISRKQLKTLVEESHSLEEHEAELLFSLLKSRYAQVRAYTRVVLQTLRFASPHPDSPVLQGLEVLRAMGQENRKKVPKDAPLDFIPQHWLRAIVKPDGIDRRAWELCLLLQTRAALRAGDVVVEGSVRYAHWDAHLYTPACWKQQRAAWFASSSLPRDAAAYLAHAKAELHSLTTKAAQYVSKSAPLQMGGDQLALPPPERPHIPPDVAPVRHALISLLPRIGLPQLLMEVDRWTGFTSAFVHLTARRQTTEDTLGALRPALFAVLVAEATNLGLTTMSAASGIPYTQLGRVYHWYVREETLQQAIKLLIAHYHRLPLATAFGSGTTSSSTALRFEAASAGAHPRSDLLAAGARQEVTLYNHISNQGVPFWTSLVHPLVDEEAYLLDGLLLQDPLPIREHTTRTPGCTDLLFGLFDLFGYRLEPPPHTLLDQPLAQPHEEGSYGPLTPVLRHRIDDALITDQWDEINRLLESLKDRLVAPSLIIPKLRLIAGHLPLREALEEVGCIARTRYLLSYLSDASLRQRILIDLHKAESLNALAQAVFFGRQGHVTDRGHEARLIRALILSLVLNAIILWNTFHLEAAIDTLAKRGQPIPGHVWPHLSPILWEHLHPTGEYHFHEPA